MRLRRLLLTLTIILAVTTAMLVLLQSVPFAQEPGAPPGPGGPPGDPAMGGMPGMPGMGGAPAGGGGFTWSETKPPPELARTYAEHLARTGPHDAQIPPQFLSNQDGTPKRATPNEWFQLQRVYKRTVSDSGNAADAAKPGRIGAGMLGRLSREDAYLHHFSEAFARAVIPGFDSFTFEIGYPKFDRSLNFTTAPGGAGTVTLPVVMRVKASAAANYPQRVLNALKKFDSLGQARAQGGSITNTSERFSVITRKGGYYHPNVLNLPPGTGAAWTGLWSSAVVVTVLLDRGNNLIAMQTQPAGLRGDVLAKMIYPDKIYFNPRYKLVLWPEGRRLDGRCWNVAGTKGWAYEFTFAGLSREEVSRIHSAQAVLVSPPIIELMLASNALPYRPGDSQFDPRMINYSEFARAAPADLLRTLPSAGGSVSAALGAAGGAAPGAAGPGAGPGMEGPGAPGMPPAGPGGMPPPPPGAPPM